MATLKLPTTPDERIATHVAEIGHGIDGVKRDLMRMTDAQRQRHAVDVLNSHCDELVDTLAEYRKLAEKGGHHD